MNWNKNLWSWAGQVFVVWTDGWRTGPGVLGLSPPLIGQVGDNGGLWLADMDNKGDRVNETDGRGTCAWLLVRFAGWLNAWDGRICLIVLEFILLFFTFWCIKPFLNAIDWLLEHWGVRMKSSRACFVCVFVLSYHHVIYAKQWWMMNPT